MNNDYQEQYATLSRLEKKNDELYHRIAVQLGLSDSAFWALFCLFDDEEVYTQNSLAEVMCLPKQTVNSTINKLAMDGYVRLEQMAVARNSKSIHLTAKGRDFCDKFIAPVSEAEEKALMRMPKDEIKAYLALSEKQSQFLQEELNLFLDAIGGVKDIERRMGALPHLRKQNKAKNKGEYGAKKLSAVLPKMQK